MKKMIPLRLAATVLAAAAALELTSCGFTDTLKEKVSQLYGEQEVTEEVTDAPEEAEVSNDITLGVLDFDTFNPLVTTSATAKDVCGFIYEPLFGIDSTMRTMGVLADGYTVSPDGTSIVITLKQGVTWHDGSAFTADDVIYTVNTIKAGNTQYTSYTDSITGIWKSDDYTVNVAFSRSVPDAVSLFTFPIAKNKSLTSSGTDFAPIGTGPFSFAYENGERYLTAYDNYYGGRASIDRVNIKLIPDSDKYVSLFNANVIDIATSETVEMSSYMPRSNSSVSDYVSNTMIFAGFNTTNALFTDSSTRRAVSELIERDPIVTNIYFSRAVASDYALNPESWLSFETRTRLRADTRTASQLLADAGWQPDQRGMYCRELNGKMQYLTIKILVNSESPERVSIAQTIADMLNNNGAKAEVDAVAHDEFNKRAAALNYDMLVGEIELLPNNDMSAVVGSQGNIFGYSDSETDTLIWQLGTVQTEADVSAVSNELFERIHTEVPFAPICFLKKSLITSAKIKGGYNPSIQGFVRETQNWSVR